MILEVAWWESSETWARTKCGSIYSHFGTGCGRGAGEQGMRHVLGRGPGRIARAAALKRGAVTRSVAALSVAVPLALAPGAAPLLPVKAGPPSVSSAAPIAKLTGVAFKKTAVKDQTKTPFKATAVTWPAASHTALPLAAPRSGIEEGARATAAGTPVWAQAVAPSKGSYAGPSSLDVKVLSHAQAGALGVAGVVFAVDGGGLVAGTVRVGLDASAFAQAYGGNYASRLHLVQLPACALTTPQLAACRVQSPLASTVDAKAKTLSALVPLAAAQSARPMSESTASAGQSAASPAMVLAATDSTGQEGGAAGSYAATSLKPSGTWSAGGSTGAFTYSYPITLPGASSSLVPTVGLGYDSSSADGQTSSTAAQASWAGDGWSTQDSYVEQTFTPCDDNPEGSASPVSTGDECYDGQILTLSLNGSSTVLVYDASLGVYKPADDNGERVTHVTGSGNGSKTYNTDYWVVTDRTGVQYEFGRNQLPGWASGDAVTNSVDYEPVYSAHSGDPCYSSSGFTASVCTAAYKWHLDYVLDPQGNAMSYYYTQDTNYYGQDNGAKNTQYVRDSYLSHIDYGFRDGAAYGTVPDKVLFTPTSRCTLSTCDALSSSTAATEYPDVPYDLVCASGATCSVYAPSYFSTARLSSITTEQYSTSASAYAAVDTYTLAQTTPATGDGTSPTLWLSSITHTGNDTSAGGSTSSISLPSVVFAGTSMPNRVNESTYPGLYRYRLTSITGEMGSVTQVTYGLPTACTATYVASANPSSNTESCYPIYWTPPGDTSQILDWFHKYAVTQVQVSDPGGGSTSQLTTYMYNGGAAWHYDDNELVKAKYRTYGQFRGYGDVITYTGNGTDPRTESETTYYRGMDGDYLSSTSTRSVTLTDSQHAAHTDTDQLAGKVLESTAYLGSGGPIDHSTVTSYWVSAATATRARTGLPALTARNVEAAETWTRQALTDGGTTAWRSSETDSTYDATTTDANFGLLTYTYSHSVPANTAYDQCTSTTYAAANTSANIVGLAAFVEKDSVACSGFTEGSIASAPSGLNTLGAPASVSRPAQVMSATQTFYDDTAFSTTFPQASAPTQGNVTMTRVASGYTSGAFTWQTKSRATYDSYGRAVDSFDADGNETSTAFVVNSVGLTTGQSVTNAKSQIVSTTFDTARNLTLTGTDVNGVVTTEQYDALGRLTSVWLDSRATTAMANKTFAYTVSNSSFSGVVTSTMNSSPALVPAVTVDDSLGRPRQTQTQTPKGGRLISDTFYDSHGWVIKKNTEYWDSANLPAMPTTSLPTPDDKNVAMQEAYTYDGLGRAVEDQSEEYSNVQSTSYTVYNGDATTTIPPTGGVTKTVATDPLGRTSALTEYTTNPTLTIPSNTFTGIWSITAAPGTGFTTSYGFDAHGNQATVTDTAGESWSTTYNLLGQAVSKSDPDAGTSSMVYDANGNLLQSTDARGRPTSYTYDSLGRKTAQYAATTATQSASNEKASFSYDGPATSYEVGKLISASSYDGGTSGNAYTQATTGYNIFGESLGEKTTIPSSEGALAGTYSVTHVYGTTTGLPIKDTYTAAGPLPAETVTHAYTSQFDLPNTLGSYEAGIGYSAWSQVLSETIGNATYGEAFLTDAYDAHTGLLTDQLTTRSTTPATVDDESYYYDPSGNTTAQSDTRLGSSSTAETQCYQYDTLDRLTTAWTDTAGTTPASGGGVGHCATTTAPTGTSHATVGDNLGSSSAYWSTWTYNLLGERTSQTKHSLTTGTADTVTTYTYGGSASSCGAASTGAHTLAFTTTTSGTAANTSYCYDAAGNATTRNTGTDTQTLTWNNAGQLTTETGASTGASYVYDASGRLLMRKDTGATTLFLGSQELVLNSTTNAVTGTRYYPLPGGGQAVRTGAGTSYGFQIADQHGTATLQLDYTAQTPTWRQFTPYGEARGTAVTWLDAHGFLNKPADTTTGLTTLGAREYDPATATFISLDPVLNPEQPLTLNGYSYTADNPIGQADPTGLDPGEYGTGVGGGAPTCDAQCQQEQVTPADIAASDPTPAQAKALQEAERKRLEAQIAQLKALREQLLELQANVSYCNSFKSGPTAQSCMEMALSGALGNAHFRWTDLLVGVGVLAGAAVCEIPGVDLLCGAAAEMMASGTTVTLDATLAAGVGGTALGAGGGALIAAKIGDALGLDTEAIAADTAEINALSCAKNSFAATTPVLMADGTSKPISQIKVGDKIANNVPGADPGTKDQTHTVTAIHITYTDRDYTDVTIDTGHGPATITGTAHHLYWDQTQHAWTPADHMHIGDQLQTPDGHTVVILALRDYTATMVTYNLTIDTLHTYYVEAGGTPVLVHNGDGCINWSWKSVKTFGHTFNEHGAGAKNLKSLTDRARSTGNAQGQWLDNEAAAEFLSKLYVPDAGPFGVKLPEGLGQVIMPDGTIVDAPYAYIIPSPNGIIKTAYPTLGEP